MSNTYDLVRCSEVYFPHPGPREPGTTAYRRHYSATEFLILFCAAFRAFFIRKLGPKDNYGHDTFVGPVRMADATHADCTPVEIPAEVIAMSTTPPPPAINVLSKQGVTNKAA